MNRLGIVIPAYKQEFLRKTLESIIHQTDQHFDLYVFDDCSPYELDSIIRPFADRCKLYHRFDENMGGKNLVSHWNRCVKMVDNEYIWLFSDDDIMSSNCVSKFYETLSVTDESYDVYRFNTIVINSNSIKVSQSSSHPYSQKVESFLVSRLSNRCRSYMPEYIFRRSCFAKNANSFVQFPLAWNSDDATWILFGANQGLKLIDNAFVNWRYSGENISSLRTNSKDKFIADCQYYSWLYKQRFIKTWQAPLLSYWLAKRIVSIYKIGFLEHLKTIYRLRCLGTLVFSLPLYLFNFISRGW